MAKSPAPKPPMKYRRRRRAPEIGGFGPLIFISLIVIAAVNFQLAILIAVGLSPTIVLGLTGKGEHKRYKLQCVAFTNMAGILPFAVQVWSRPRAFSEIIMDPLILVTMFGSAAIGYALIYVGPMVAAVVLQSFAQDRIKTLNQQRAALLEAWGPEVLGDTEPKVEEPSWAGKGRRSADD